jgi:hypothetical protein
MTQFYYAKTADGHERRLAPKGAYDAVGGKRFGDDRRHHGDDRKRHGRDEEEHGGMSKRELMLRGLEGLGDTFPISTVMDIYDACHGMDRAGESAEEWERHEDRPREPKMPDDAEDEEAETESEHGAGMARRMMEGDRRRSARDSRLGMDAKDVFDQMFGTDRIKADTDLR